MKTCLAIPARLDSSRLHHKLLQVIHQRTVLEHTLHNALQTTLFDEIILVTDHPTLADIGHSLGVRVELTTATYRNGTERIGFLLDKIQADVIVNLQADEVKFPACFIEQILSEARGGTDMVSAMYPIQDIELFQDPNVVKVICNHRQEALYFSRAPIPYQSTSTVAYGHIGVYSYQRHVLEHLITQPPCLLEQQENLEQLRALFLGYTIKMITTPFFPSINSSKDLDVIRAKYESSAPHVLK